MRSGDALMGAVKRAVTNAEADTEAIAAEFALQLQPGDVVHISGEVGAGKTTFVRGSCRQLGVQGPVTSPSYTICNRYEATSAQIAHLDCQRLEAQIDQEGGLLDDALGPQTITFIEWPQTSAETVGLLASVAPSFTVEISHRDQEKRELTISNRLAEL